MSKTRKVLPGDLEQLDVENQLCSYCGEVREPHWCDR